jgi:hypothetical protein
LISPAMVVGSSCFTGSQRSIWLMPLLPANKFLRHTCTLCHTICAHLHLPRIPRYKQHALVEHMFVVPQRCDAAQACDYHPSLPTWGGGGGSSNNSAARSPSPGTARCSSARSSRHAAALLVAKNAEPKGDERGVSLAMVFACALAARARAWKLLFTAASCEGAVGGASGQQAAMVCGIVAGGCGHRAALASTLLLRLALTLRLSFTSCRRCRVTRRPVRLA